MNTVETALDWEISEVPVTINNKISDKYKAIVRSDNGNILNVSKNSYTPTQNNRFIEVAEKIRDTTGFALEGYSVFHGGAKTLAYLKAEEGKDLMGLKMQNFMVIGNSHDGSSGFFVGGANLMIRCMNQWGRVSQDQRIFHTKNHDLKINEILSYFDRYKAEQDAMYQKMQDYSKVKIDSGVIVALTERLFRIDNKEEEVLSTRKQNVIDGFLSSVERETKDLGDNLFGLFHGVSHFTTHVKKTREAVFGNIIGANATINSNAMKFCDALAY